MLVIETIEYHKDKDIQAKEGWERAEDEKKKYIFLNFYTFTFGTRRYSFRSNVLSTLIALPADPHPLAILIDFLEFSFIWSIQSKWKALHNHCYALEKLYNT